MLDLVDGFLCGQCGRRSDTGSAEANGAEEHHAVWSHRVSLQHNGVSVVDSRCGERPEPFSRPLSAVCGAGIRGAGGGGAGTYFGGPTNNGTANTGGGGGGRKNASDTNAGAGGSGIVIIAYRTNPVDE